MDEGFIRRVIPERISEPRARISFPTQLSYYLLAMISSFLPVSLNTNAVARELALRQRRKELDRITEGEGPSDAYAVSLLPKKEQHRSISKPGIQVQA